MCEFCTKHGEGKKWYLQMRNYSREWLKAPLTPDEEPFLESRTRGQDCTDRGYQLLPGAERIVNSGCVRACLS